MLLSPKRCGIVLLLIISISEISATTTHKVQRTSTYDGHGCVEAKLRNRKLVAVSACDFFTKCTDFTLEEPIPCEEGSDGCINGVKYITTYSSAIVECDDFPHKHVCPTGTRKRDSDSDSDSDCSAMTGLDPHFRKLNQVLFSYHGECDLVLVSSRGFASGVGLDIHIRTEIKKSYSFIKALSMRVGNDTLEMEGKDNFHINGVFWEQPNQFAGFPIFKIGNATWCRDKCFKAQIYRIFFDFDEYVELANWAGFLHVEMNGPNFKDSTGLLGSRKDTGMVGRDGNLIADVNKYGQEWQVMGSDPQLFQMSRYPQHPDPCIQPEATFRRISESTMRMAQHACSYLSGELYDICIFDVSSTGDENLAYSPFYN